MVLGIHTQVRVLAQQLFTVLGQPLMGESEIYSIFMAKTGGVGPSPPFFRLCSTLLDEMLCFAEHFRQPKEQSVHMNALLVSKHGICRQQSIQTACLQRPVALLSWKPLKMFVFQPFHRKSMAWHRVKCMSGMSHARFSLDAGVGPIRFMASTSLASQKVSLKTQLLKEIVPQILKVFATSHSKSYRQGKRRCLDLLGSVCAESISNCSRCSSFTAATTLAGGLKCTALGKENQFYSHVQCTSQGTEMLPHRLHHLPGHGPW